ncbi:MAG: ABC transporter permease [Pseudomonadota bacterium]
MHLIASDSGINLFSDLRETVNRWELLRTLSVHRALSRLRGTFLGHVWQALSFAVFTFGVSLLWIAVFKIESQHFLPHVALGLFIFWYVSGAIIESTRSITTNAGLALQNRLPMAFFPMLAVGKHTLIAAYSIPTVVIAMAMDMPQLTNAAFLAIPGLLLCLLLTSGASILVSYICVYIQDLAELLSAIMRFMFFLTPVIWMAEDRLGLSVILIVNPLHHAINVVRGPILSDSGVLFSFAVMIGLNIVCWSGAWLAYRRFGRKVLLRI